MITERSTIDQQKQVKNNGKSQNNVYGSPSKFEAANNAPYLSHSGGKRVNRGEVSKQRDTQKISLHEIALYR